MHQDNKPPRYQPGLVRAAALTMVLGLLGASAQIAGPASALNARTAKASVGTASIEQASSKATKANSGQLTAMVGNRQIGQCPLEHTDVKATISGYVAHVSVKQIFKNTYKEKIEAIYTFPLSEQGAVDQMKMRIGDRTIIGTIKKREEARQIYEDARNNGQTASLLDQERTNIFTQSVANIEPGQQIEITIDYVETLPFEDGQFAFTFPTVVGPRFVDMPDKGDMSRLNTTYAPEGTRSGHDISISVDLDAGMRVEHIRSKLHEVSIKESESDKSRGRAHIQLADKATIPNKDFVLTYDVSQSAIKSGYLAFRNADKPGYFTLMVVPPKKPTIKEISPKEMIFVIDCSGSQSGPPLDKCKQTMRYILEHMNPNDTFQIIAFNSSQSIFADKPQTVSESMKKKAIAFIDALQANGGTWMAPAVEKACAIPNDQHRLRIVTFMTDGYVGNDLEILSMIKKYRDKSRWFSFGTGNSVNRTLIDGIAREGGGEAEYVLLNSPAEEAGAKFYKRISTPVLTDVKLGYRGPGPNAKLTEIFPKEIHDVWAQKPLYFKGRYAKPGKYQIDVTGFSGGAPYKQTIDLELPEQDTANSGIASMWARAKVDRLMSEDYMSAQNGGTNKELKDEIVQVALEHRIMTQYTSFVAVDDKATKDKTKGQPTTIRVQSEMPEGVSRQMTLGAMGGAGGNLAAMPSAAPSGFAFAARESKSDASISYGRRAGFMPPAPSLYKKKEADKSVKPEAERQAKISDALLQAMQNSNGKPLSISIQLKSQASALPQDLLALLKELGLKYQIIKQDGRIAAIKLKATASQIHKLSANAAVSSLEPN